MGWPFDNIGQFLSTVPGALVTAATSPIHFVAEVSGHIGEVTGQITHQKQLEDWGRNLHQTDERIVTSVLKDPVNSALVVVGGIGVATGVATAPSLALLAKGAAGLAGDVAAALPSPQAPALTGSAAAPAPAQAVITDAPGVKPRPVTPDGVRRGAIYRAEAWVVDELHKLEAKL